MKLFTQALSPIGQRTEINLDGTLHDVVVQIGDREYLIGERVGMLEIRTLDGMIAVFPQVSNHIAVGVICN